VVLGGGGSVVPVGVDRSGVVSGVGLLAGVGVLRPGGVSSSVGVLPGVGPDVGVSRGGGVDCASATRTDRSNPKATAIITPINSAANQGTRLNLSEHTIFSLLLPRVASTCQLRTENDQRTRATHQ